MSDIANGSAWPAARVRQQFIDFFVNNHQHTFVASSPVVPHDDNTLLFANAGMNQFKPKFLGTVSPDSPLAPMKRACNSQKCIRAGGKHNDLDDVGLDTYHHTFFEMLGNWSFGDYFKEQAIDMAMSLLVDTYGLPKERIYATYFGGDESQGLEPDLEAKQIWLKHLPDARILPFDCKDNFWEMGETGPCGPCTELHFDRIGGRDAASLVNMDDPTVIEIWNLVFIQFNREPDGSLRLLPNKHVDTGMGFERVTSILQNKMSNYDTDVFMPIFDAIKEATGCRPYSGLLGKEDTDGVDMAYRVVADHIRTLTFAITDGAVPDSDGRGYVLRRVLRRAVRYGREFLNAQPKFFSNLVDSVVSSMGEAFPELHEKRKHVMEVIAHEETAFLRTLDRGTDRFKQIVDELKKTNAFQISGADAFFLYDTMGFPLDLTQRMAEEVGFTVDEKGYAESMKAAKEMSRADRAMRSGVSGVRLVLEAEETAFLIGKEVKPTDDNGKYVWNHTPSARVMAIFAGGRGSFVESTSSLSPGAQFGIILDKTSFYAEAGGQIADTGSLLTENGETLLVEVGNCQVYGGFVLHIGSMAADASPLTVGQTVQSSVDYENRSKIAPNHTMTHVLNFALREVLGDSVDQKGSLVDAAKLRFDFSHKTGLTTAELIQVEDIVKCVVKDSKTVYTKVTPLADAKAIHSLRAVFGETYPDPVRVVSVGRPVEDLVADPKNQAWSAISIEFCGGTHLRNTKEAQDFVIIEESALATGIRRLTAYTKGAAAEANSRGKILEEKVTMTEAMDPMALPDIVPGLVNEVNEAVMSAILKGSLREKLSKLSKKSAEALKARSKGALEEGLLKAEKEVAAVKETGGTLAVVLVPLEGDSKGLSKLVTKLSGRLPEGAVMGITVDHKKNLVRCCATSKTVPVNKWVTNTMTAFQGKGGGKPTNANGTAPFTDDDHVVKLVNFARSWEA
ncbi:Alanine--tRNA ligase [Gracilariopsis chorda]|uniref:Alanine--tRNA ligase n=1 Tax=Gracilariopsis chorda TaxID=448386 RepID=A0A2V3J0D7_9FLOR|nr:Alanine--tRNA ligase [Gracilariopsis chorda]|eukprot:PXF47861.1 Alanine--tRNA ligase [Gracilariopsis chorda]